MVRRHASIKDPDAVCVYCGGIEPADTVDHIPPIGMFPNRDRPKGLEVPSCEACNRNSRRFEDVAAMVTAIRLEGSDKSSLSNQHFGKKLRAVANNQPAVISEMRPTTRQARNAARILDSSGRPLGAIDVRGPLISRAMLAFGGKLGLALHYHAKGVPLPQTGRVGVIWQSNESLIDDCVPQALFSLLPETKMLAMGRKTSAGRFEYSSGVVSDTQATAHWAVFGTAVAYLIFAGETINMDMLPDDQIFRPGFLNIEKAGAID